MHVQILVHVVLHDSLWQQLISGLNATMTLTFVLENFLGLGILILHQLIQMLTILVSKSNFIHELGLLASLEVTCAIK